MLDLMMLALVITAFAAAITYIGACRKIERHPDSPHKERE